MMKRSSFGFTLAELLVALAILGVIATFTIPKVLQAQQNGQYSAMAKEAAATISAAYDAYKLTHTPTASFTAAELTPYLNYVSLQTGAFDFLDPEPGNAGFLGCSAGNPCVKLHNGGALYMANTDSFGGTAQTNAVLIHFDPDGVYTGDDKADSTVFALYVNGRLTSLANVLPNTCTQTFCPFGPDSTKDPTYFHW